MAVEILALGEPLLELNAEADGALAAAESFGVGYGGDTSNFAIAARRCGASVGYITRIGDDAFGQKLLDLWEREGVDATHVIREPGGATGLYFVARGATGHGFTYYRSGSPASRLRVEDVPVEAIGAARLLHVSGISQAISNSACDAAFHAIEVARASGTLVSYDPNHRATLWQAPRARAIVMETARLSDIVLPSLEDGRALVGLSEPEAVLGAFVDAGPGVVVLKLGPEGALVAHAGEVTHVRAHPVTALDASGAGDTFDGAFMTRLLEGASPVEAARFAVVAAALTTTGHGAVGPVPRRRDVEALLVAAGSA